VVVAVAFVGPVKPAGDQVVGVVTVRNGLVSASVTMSVRRITARRVGVVAGVRLIDCDHVLVNVVFMGVMQVAVV
jgi:hypothetical protein